MKRHTRFLICAALLGLASNALAASDLVIAIHPYLSAKEIYQKFGPLKNHLKKVLKRPISIRVAKDYPGHIEAVGKDEVDIAYLGPASYVEMVETYGKKPILARLEINGEPTFKGAVIMSPDNAFKEIKELEGKRFAFGSPHSTMSHLVPRYMLIEAGITKDKLAAMDFLGKHDKVALAVLQNAFDAGAVKEAVYHKYKERGLKLLAWTPPISEHLFVASTKLPEDDITAIRAAMHEIKDKSILTPIKSTITGLVQASDDDYENLRNILKSLKEKGIPEPEAK